jgi:hypothetical protein
MTKRFRHALGFLGISLALASQTAFALAPGQKLSEAQIAQLGVLQMYDIGGTQLRVIPAQQPGQQETLLINAQGIVGSSRNEITISRAPEAGIQAQLQQMSPQPASVRHYEPTGITVLRYADFAQAVEGLRALKAALPGAHVRLGVRFTTPVPN